MGSNSRELPQWHFIVQEKRGSWKEWAVCCPQPIPYQGGEQRSLANSWQTNQGGQKVQGRSCKELMSIKLVTRTVLALSHLFLSMTLGCGATKLHAQVRASSCQLTYTTGTLPSRGWHPHMYLASCHSRICPAGRLGFIRPAGMIVRCFIPYAAPLLFCYYSINRLWPCLP